MSNSSHETELLVTTDWLAARLDDPGIRMVDTRKGDAYKTAHVPGATDYPESITPFLKDSGRIQGPEKFAILMAELRVADDSLVVAYDDGNNLFAARLWWALNYYGHSRVAVLDGGWDLWVAEGRAVDAKQVSPPKAAFTPRIEEHWIAE
ncbi:MAG TPA: rhodanese-like domain-containing protein [Candidatus Binataceae bacterium]|nr:rhodanese-like domain-containing protein [Candidatus Binataceae bacterium]